MKILVVKNPTKYISNVTDALAGHDIEIVEYKPGIQFNTTGKDLIVLSGGGGEGFEIVDKFKNGDFYRDQLNFILDCKKPMVGICMGFELMAHAYGSDIKRLAGGVNSLQTFRTKEGSKISQFEWHDFAVHDISQKHFEVLAESEAGIEIIRHRAKPMLGVQFHPERGGSLQLSDLLAEVA